MDDEPFLSFNVLDDEEELFLSSLEQFHKANFNLKEILSKAVFLKYIKVVEQTLKQDLINPSDELVKYFLSRPEIKANGRITAQIIEKHRAATAETMRKVMGVTINKPNTEAANDQAPKVSSNPIMDYFKQLSPEIECDLEKIQGITIIYVVRNNNKIGRLRFSMKNNVARYDYTDLGTGKLSFIHNVDECEKFMSFNNS